MFPFFCFRFPFKQKIHQPQHSCTTKELNGPRKPTWGQRSNSQQQGLKPWNRRAGEKAPELCLILPILGMAQGKYPATGSHGREDPLHDAFSSELWKEPKEPASHPLTQPWEAEGGIHPTGHWSAESSGSQLAVLPGPLHSPSREMSQGHPHPVGARGTEGAWSLG